MRQHRGTARRWSGVLRCIAIVLACCGFWACDAQEAEREIEFWTISLKPTFNSFIEGQIARFEQDHPGVKVVWVDVPFAAVDRKLIAAAAAGRMPDVVNISDMMFARFAGLGAFAPLEGSIPEGGESRYHAGALRTLQLDEHLYALPWYLTTQAMIVNADLLSQGGLSVETVGRSWGALLAQAGPFRDRTGRFLLTQPIGVDSQLPVMLLAEGIVPFEQRPDGSIRASLLRDDVAEFVDAWVQAYRQGALPREAATRGFEHLIDVYKDERVAVLNTGANFLGRVKGMSPRVYEVSSVLPPVTGALGRAHIAVMSVCVSAQSKHPDLAVDFAWHITGPEAQGEFCRLATILPSTTESLEDAFFAGPTDDERREGVEKIGAARALVAEVLLQGEAFTPAMRCWPDMRRSFNDHVKRALLGSIETREALRQVEADWNRILDQANARRLAGGLAPLGMEVIPRPALIGEPVP